MVFLPKLLIGHPLRASDSDQVYYSCNMPPPSLCVNNYVCFGDLRSGRLIWPALTYQTICLFGRACASDARMLE